MKNKYVLISFMVLLFATLISGQEWKKAAVQSLPSFYSSFFLNANVGWFVGSKGLIMKTNDGGRTWTDITTAITEDLKSVFFLDENTGFIGSAAKLYKSTDGFTSYTSVDVTGALTSSPSYFKIYFSNTQNGWVLSSTSSVGKILQTTDGGATWTNPVNNTAGNLQTMDFFSGTAGITAGGGSGKCDIYFTNDGTTWTKAAAPTFPPGYTRTDIRGVYMCNTNVAYATGWGSMVGNQASIHIKTTDGGATWTYLSQSETNKVYDNMYGFYFKDANTGLVSGGGTKTSILLKTVDGGVNWEPIDIPCGSQISKLFGFGDIVIAATNSGSFLKSTNFGTTWELLTQIPITTLNAIFAVNDNIIYAGGQDGVLLKTTDAGKTWQTFTQRVNNAGSNIQGLYFVNENLGYSANSYSMIAKTTNGGITWTACKGDSTAATFTNYAVTFTSADVGFIVGKAGSNKDVIYKTTDGGVTFITTTNVVSANLRGIAFFNSQIGAVVAEKMKAMYTTDGGTTWQASTISGVPAASATATLREVAFITANEAIAVGDKVTLRTTDGGATWNYINTAISQSLTGVAFLNNVTWAVGVKTASPKSIGILESTDNGQSWSNQVNYNVFDSLNSVYDITISPSGAAYVCGGLSSVYTNSILVSVEENGNELPTVFELKQNYPNPFNPSTKINYIMNQAGVVKLNVYDVLGRLVKSLLNKYQDAGSHSIQFDANGLASGAYIYTLSINNSITSKKMILIK